MTDQSQPLGITIEQMERIVTAAVTAARAPDALQAKQLEEEVQRQKRQNLLSLELAKVEQEKQDRRKNGCSHSRYENGGKNAGMPAPKGTGEWTTGGQLVGRDEALLVCLRCAWSWKWTPTYEEKEFIKDQGMLGMKPPPPDRITWEG